MRLSGEGVFWMIVALAVGAGLYLYTAKHPAKPPARFYQKERPAKDAAADVLKRAWAQDDLSRSRG